MVFLETCFLDEQEGARGPLVPLVDGSASVLLSREAGALDKLLEPLVPQVPLVDGSALVLLAREAGALDELCCLGHFGVYLDRGT